MLLDTIIKKNNNVTGDVFIADGSKSLEIDVNGKLIEFFAPLDSKIFVKQGNPITQLYYKIVVGLMFEFEDFEYESIVVGGVTIPRSKIWIPYEKFLTQLETQDDSKFMKNINFDLNFQSKDGIWDNLVAFMDENDDVDYADLADNISQTMKEKIEAELVHRGLIKNKKPLPKLF